MPLFSATSSSAAMLSGDACISLLPDEQPGRERMWSRCRLLTHEYNRVDWQTGYGDVSMADGHRRRRWEKMDQGRSI